MKPSVRIRIKLPGTPVLPLLIVLGLLQGFFPGCAPKAGSLPASSGKTLELLVVVDRQDGGKQLPVAVTEVFQCPQPALNQPEPRFDLMVLPAREFQKIFNTHHNILDVKINSSIDREGIKILHDRWARPQVVVELSARSDSSADRLIRKNAVALLQAFYASEHEKIAQLFSGNAAPSLSDSLLQKQDCSLILPECFYIAASGPGHFWLRCRDEEKETGLIIARLPYTDTAVFATSVMMHLCDSLASALIPGSRPGSYMTLYKGEAPQACQSDIHQHFAMELRGLWETRNDQMGGPFLAYLMPYPSRKQLLVQYAYVYHPNAPKRDLLMQMEAIMHTVRFRGEK